VVKFQRKAKDRQYVSVVPHAAAGADVAAD
jgi:hypothetical protein